MRRPSLKNIHGPLYIDTEVRTHTHRGDHDTSILAAESALSRSPKSCRRIHGYLLDRGGRTDEEGQRDLRMFSYPKRRCDLFYAGLVADSGKRRDSSQGAPMIVWVAT